MKTVLVTGSAGFLGSHIVDHMIANTDHRIVGLDSFRHRGDSLRVYQDPSRYTVYRADLAAPISDRVTDKIGPVDYIVNAASESHVDRSIADPVPFVMNNTALALNVLEYARVVKPKAFIQVSTDEVYGAAQEDHDHKEWEPILPSNPYAASKAAQEAIAVSYWRTYGVPLCLVNCMNIFGERQDSEKYIPMSIKRVQAGETVTVHGSEGHVGSRKYLHARNVSDALGFLLDQKRDLVYNPSNLYPDRFNVVGDVEMNNLEIAQLVAEVLRKPLKYKFLDFHAARPGHDARYSLDGSKLAALGWKSPIGFYESLKRTVEWALINAEWLR